MADTVNSTTTTPNSSHPHYNDSVHISLWAIEPYHEAIVVPVVFGVIFVVGLIGNGTLIFTVAANKAMRNMPNILIVNLSLGDVLLILVSVPLTSTLYTFTNWPYGALACKVNNFLQTWSLGVTVFTLTALSIDRYLVIMDPMAKHKRTTQSKAVAKSSVIWIVSFFLALPEAVLSNEVTRTHYPTYEIKICSTFPDRFYTADQLVPKIHSLVRFIVFFVVPVVTTAVFYRSLARALVRSGHEMPCEGRQGGSNQQRIIAVRKKVARVVFGFVVIFIVCWLPRHIYLLWFFFDDSNYNEFWHYFKITGFCLTYINSCVNPFALYVLSSQFREYFDRYLFGCFKKVAYTMIDHSNTRITVTQPESPCRLRRLLLATFCLGHSDRDVKGRMRKDYRFQGHQRGRAIVKQPSGRIRGVLAEVTSSEMEIRLKPHAWRKSPPPSNTPSPTTNYSPSFDSSNRIFQFPLQVEIHAPDEGSPRPGVSVSTHTVRRQIWQPATTRQDSTVTIGGDCSGAMVYKRRVEKKQQGRRGSSP